MFLFFYGGDFGCRDLQGVYQVIVEDVDFCFVDCIYGYFWLLWNVEFVDDDDVEGCSEVLGDYGCDRNVIVWEFEDYGFWQDGVGQQFCELCCCVVVVFEDCFRVCGYCCVVLLDDGGGYGSLKKWVFVFEWLIVFVLEFVLCLWSGCIVYGGVVVEVGFVLLVVCVFFFECFFEFVFYFFGGVGVFFGVYVLSLEYVLWLVIFFCGVCIG